MTSSVDYRFSVKVVKEYEVRRGVYWEGDIYHNDIKCGDCYNDGDGGQTCVEFYDHKTQREFMRIASLLYPDSYEPDSYFAKMLSNVSEESDDDENDPSHINTRISALASMVTTSSGILFELDLFYIANDDLNKIPVPYIEQSIDQTRFNYNQRLDIIYSRSQIFSLSKYEKL